jgi:SPP1 family predicted phage head-tail adaptor
VKAEKLNKRVVIESASMVANAAGELVETWPPTAGATVATVWAQISPLNAREAQDQANRMEARTTHKAWIRYLAGVNSGMRLKWGSRVFAIAEVIDPEERHEMLALLCTEKTL